MKYLLATFLIVMAVVMADAQDIIYANQVTVEWDAVTTLDNGDPIPPADVMSYEVYVTACCPINLPQSPAAHISQGVTTALTMTVTLPNEGDFAIGVRTVRLVGGDTANAEFSDINWSDVNGVNTPVPFIVRFQFRPAIPSNLRVQ